MYCFSAKHTFKLIQTLGITTAGSCVVWTAAQTKQTKAKSMSHKISSSSLDPLNWSRDQKGEEGKEEVSLRWVSSTPFAVPFYLTVQEF